MNQKLKLSPELSIQNQERQKIQQRDRSWKTPIRKYRNKRFFNCDASHDDINLEELYWKQSSKAYNLYEGDTTDNRVNLWKRKGSFDNEDENKNRSNYIWKSSKAFQKENVPLSKGASHHYSNRRPSSIETASISKLEDERMATPDTVPMDDDEFTSPHYSCTPTSVASSIISSIAPFDSSPSIVRSPKATLDEQAMDHHKVSTLNNVENGISLSTDKTEETAGMFEKGGETNEHMSPLFFTFLPATNRDSKAFTSKYRLTEEGKMSSILVQRMEVTQLTHEHERLTATTNKNIVSMPDSGNKFELMKYRDTELPETATPSCPSDKAKKETVDENNEPFIHRESSSREIEVKLEKQHLEISGYEARNVLKKEEKYGTFLPRSSILTTIIEELSPHKRACHRFESSKSLRSNKRFCKTKTDCQNDRVPSMLKGSPEKEFKAGMRKRLNKVTIATALIEFYEALMEQSKPSYDENIATESTPMQAISKRKRNRGFFTGATPTYVSMKRNAAIVIQAFFRQVLATRFAKRKKCIAREFAAKLIQAEWRAYDTRMTLKWHRGSAVLLQAKLRSRYYQKQYALMRSSTILVQSITRMYFSQTSYQHCRVSARIIQTRFRCYVCQKQYKLLFSSIIFVQSVARMRYSRSQFTLFKASINIIQATSRMFLRRRKFLECRRAITIFQAVIRMNLCCTRYTSQIRASTKLQTAWRKYFHRSNYMKFQKAVVQLQTLSRMYICQLRFLELNRVSITLQAALRMGHWRSKYMKCKMAATKIQSSVRMYRCRVTYFECKDALIELQAAMKMYICRSNYLQCKKGITALQANTRKYICREQYLKQQSASITLQAKLRMHCSRANFLAYQAAALIVQTAVREYMLKEDYTTLEAIREAQTKWLPLTCKNYYQALVEIMKIPTSHRTSIRKMNFIHHISSNIIQAGWRGYIYRKAFASTRCIQAKWRAFIRQKTYIKTKISSKLIQTSWRRFVTRKNYVLIKSLAICLQRRWRIYRCHKSYAYMLASALLIQTNHRAFICKQEYSRSRTATIKIQSIWRSYKCRQEHLRSLMSVTKLQTCFRSSCYRKNYTILITNRFVVKLQSIVRMHFRRKHFIEHKASKMIQAVARMYLCRNRLLSYLNAIEIIRTSFRASVSRESIVYPEPNLANNGLEYDYNKDEESFPSGSSILTTMGENSTSGKGNSPLESLSGSSQSRFLRVQSSNKIHFADESKDESTHVLRPKNKLIDENKGHPPEVNVEAPSVTTKEESGVTNEKLERIKIQKAIAAAQNQSRVLVDRRDSEKRLLALAAKVVKRRAALDKSIPEIITKDPWRKRVERQDNSRPVLLSQRINELNYLASQKRVLRNWNKNEEQMLREDGIVQNKPLARYSDVSGNPVTGELMKPDNKDPVVKKLFELGGNVDVPSIKISSPRNDLVIELHEIRDRDQWYSSTCVSDDSGEVKSSVSDDEDKGAISFETDVHNLILAKSVSKEGVWNEICCSGNEPGHARRSWTRRFIVNDLAENIYEFETYSEDDSFDGTEQICTSKVFKYFPRDEGISRLHKDHGVLETRSAWNEWHIVDDLIDDVDAEM